MAFNLLNGTSGRRSRGLPAMAEINVTPFVDVALVLLIIFMITAHAIDYGIEVEVPKTKKVETNVKDMPAVVSLDKSGSTYIGSSPVPLLKLASEIRSRFPGQTVVYVRADGAAKWDPVAQVLQTLGDQKFSVSVVTQPDNSGPHR